MSDVASAKIAENAETARPVASTSRSGYGAGQRSEIDHLNGLIVRRGERWASRTPANGAAMRSSVIGEQ